MSQPTIILGAGLIGVSTAYYLSSPSSNSSSQPGQNIHLIDPSRTLFTSASGFAAGFLSRSWFPAPLRALGELSFDLHTELAQKEGGREKWGWCKARSVSFVEDEDAGEEKERPENWLMSDDWLAAGVSRAEAAKSELGWRKKSGPEWLRRARGREMRVLSGKGGPSETAQVDPLRFSNFLLSECLSRGVHLHTSTHTLSVSRNSSGQIHSIRIRHANGTEANLPCFRLAITSGAWTPQIFSTLFPSSDVKLPITSLAGHSLLMRSSAWKRPLEGEETAAVFSTDPMGYFPEMFARVDGTIYLAGLNSSILPLPAAGKGKAQPHAESIDQLKATAEHLCGLSFASNEIEVVREALCFRPVTPKGVPIIARVPDARLGERAGSGSVGGVFVAAGHGPWGISLSLGTGKVLGEMVEGRKVSADVRELGL